MVAAGRGERSAHFGVRQTARQRRTAVVPQLGGEVASVLLDEQLHECAGVEVDQRHRSASLLADEFSDGPMRARPGLPLRPRPTRLRRPGDEAIVREALEHRSRPQPDELRHWDPTLCHDDLLAGINTGEPVAEMGAKFGDGNIHPTSAHFERNDMT